nr:hypothetical protein StreXyl84_65560 [Streptomyces sp. Xyl84]
MGSPTDVHTRSLHSTGGPQGRRHRRQPLPNPERFNQGEKWRPGATYNFITRSWDTPFDRAPLGPNLFANLPDWGIVQDEKADNGWESSRFLFLGWLWGGGYPLGDHQSFLAVTRSRRSWRSIRRSPRCGRRLWARPATRG